jgi:hypothetical protein
MSQLYVLHGKLHIKKGHDKEKGNLSLVIDEVQKSSL